MMTSAVEERYKCSAREKKELDLVWEDKSSLPKEVSLIIVVMKCHSNQGKYYKQAMKRARETASQYSKTMGSQRKTETEQAGRVSRDPRSTSR